MECEIDLDYFLIIIGLAVPCVRDRRNITRCIESPFRVDIAVEVLLGELEGIQCLIGLRTMWLCDAITWDNFLLRSIVYWERDMLLGRQVKRNL